MHFRKYVTNISWLFLSKGISIALKLIIGIYVIRYLSPSEYGLFNYAIAIYSIIEIIASLGQREILVKEIVLNPSKVDELIGISIILRFSTSILLVILSVFYFYITNNLSYENFLLIVAISGSIFQLFQPICYYFESKVEAKYSVLSTIISSSFVGILKLTFVYLELPLLCFIILLPVEFALMNLGFFLFYRKPIKISVTKQEFFVLTTNLMRESWPLIIINLMILLYTYTDKIMIRHLIDDYNLGVYSVGVKLYLETFFIGKIIVETLFPGIINSKKNEDKSYIIKVRNIITGLSILAIILILIFYFGAFQITVFLFTEKYFESARILQISVLGFLPGFIMIPFQKYLILEGKGNLLLYSSLIGLTLNLSLNLILIPRYGIHGASLASIISIYFTTFIFFNLFRSTRFYWKELIVSLSLKAFHGFFKKVNEIAFRQT